MSSIKIQPHIGKCYGETCNIFKGKRILALGESVYCREEDAQDVEHVKHLTENLVKEYLHFRIKGTFEHPEKYAGGWTNTYLKFERALVGKETNPKESFNIWDSIVFYNYLQTPITEGARVSGTDKAYAESQKAFIEIVKEYKPEVIIVWGVGILYDSLPPTSEDGLVWHDEEYKANGYSIHNGKYTWKSENGKETCKVIAIYHPSSGFSWSWWHDDVISPMIFNGSKLSNTDYGDVDVNDSEILELSEQLDRIENRLYKLLQIKKNHI